MGFHHLMFNLLNPRAKVEKISFPPKFLTKIQLTHAQMNFGTKYYFQESHYISPCIITIMDVCIKTFIGLFFLQEYNGTAPLFQV